jgi:uncharacterized membrane protein
MVPLALALHALAAIVWVGGMFFAHMALRPVLGGLAPPERLKLWEGIFPRFFFWVWIAVATLLATGYAIVFLGYGGFKALGLHVHLMQGTGLLMMGLFAWMFFGPYRTFRRAVAAGDFPTAGLHQGRIRRVVVVNLTLGLITAAMGASRGFLF